MKKIFFICLLTLFAAVVQAQTTRYVDASGGTDTGDCSSSGSPCKTITYAVSQAQSGDIVEVAAGTYNTSLGESATITLNKQLTLKGAQADVTPNLPTSDRTALGEESCGDTSTLPESILDGINLVITTDGVVVNGFEILNGNIQVDASGITIKYCMITPASTQRAIERTGTGTRTNWLLEENRIGHKDGFTMDAEGIVVQEVNGVHMRRNYVWKANGAFRLINVTDVLFEENVINKGAQWASNQGCPEADFRGNPTPATDSDVSFFGLSIEGNSSNLRIERNEFSELVSDSQQEEGLIRIYASELAGSCSFENNIFLKGSANIPLILIPDAYSSYTHNYILFRENFMQGSNPLVDVGTGSPTGSIDANANNWGLKKVGSSSEKNDIVAGSTAARSALKTITYFFLVGASEDQDLPAYGYQSSRQISYSSSANTLQEAIDATPADPLSRWILYLFDAEYPPSGVFDKPGAATINRPMILDGLVNDAGTTTLTSTSHAGPLLEITSDSVTVRNIIMRLTMVANTAIKVKGSNQVEISNLQLQVNNGVSDFTHIIIDSEDASANLEQNSVLIANCSFGATSAAGVGRGVAIYNSNKGVSGQATPVYASIRVQDNSFAANLEYYIYMDGASGKEVDADIDISSNVFAGKLPSAMSEAEKYALVDKIIDGIDVYNTGHCYFENNVLYATTNSFYLPYTTTPDLSRPIAHLQDGGVVKFLPGSYPNVIVVNKGATLRPNGNGDFTAAGIDINAPGKELILEGKLTIDQSLTLTAGYVRSTYDFVLLRNTVVNGGNNGSYVRAPVHWDLSMGSGPTTVHFPIGEAGQNQYRGIIFTGIDGDAVLFAETQTTDLSGVSKGSSVNGIIGNRYWKVETVSGSITTNGEVEIFFGNGDGVNASNHLYLVAAQAPGLLGTYEALLPATTNTYPEGSVKGAHQTIGSGNAYFVLAYSCPSVGPQNPTITTTSAFYDESNQTVYICEGASVKLEASINDPGFTYRWQQSNDGVNWSDIPGATAASYTAAAPVEPNERYYRYVAQDLCFTVTSPSIRLLNPATPPSLAVLSEGGQPVTAPIELFLGNTVNLQLQINGGYGLEQVSWEPSEGIDNPTAQSVVLTAVNPGTTTYTVTVKYAEGCQVQTTFEVIAIEDYFLPNAFSPNGDGVNDTFKFFGFGVAELSFRVFNRFGQLVYETNRVDDLMNTGWDGRSLDGQELPGGVYIWELKAKKVNGDPITLNGKTSGTLMILR